MMDSKHVHTPMDHNAKLLPNQIEPFSNPRRYHRLTRKLNTQPYISFAVSVVRKLLNSPCNTHWDVEVQVKVYYIGTKGTLKLLVTLMQQDRFFK